MTEHEFSKLASEFALPIETVLSESATVEEALTSLRKKKIGQKIIYFYAIDEEGKLMGVVSARQLLLAEPHCLINQIMQMPVVKIGAAESMRDAMELFEKHSLLALPVVDQNEKLLGSIDIQTMTQEPVNSADQRSRSDAFQMIGITLEEKKKIPLLQGFTLRMPWLLCNVFSGLVCAVISRVFELVLSKVLLLAFFIPLVLTLSESTSMQSMAQSLQFLRRPRFSWKSIQVKAFREWQLVFLLALSLGILVGGISLLWGDGFLPSFAIGVGILSGVSISAVFGIGVPIALNRMKLDPKVASGPVVLMIVDIIATAVYLGIATWWLI